LLKIFPISNQAKIHFANLKLLYAADARVISGPYKQGKDMQTASLMIIIQIQMHHFAVTTYAKFLPVSCAT
jgi:uncharacterized protein YciI